MHQTSEFYADEDEEDPIIVSPLVAQLRIDGSLPPTFDFDDHVNVAKLEFSRSSLFIPHISISLFISCLEPVVMGFGINTSWGLQLQYSLLSLGSILYALQLLMIMCFEHSNKDCFHKLSDLVVGEAAMELCCLAWGWVFIEYSPGIATLRCARTITFLWWTEFFAVKQPKEDPRRSFMNIFTISKLGVLYLNAMGTEIFTAKSRGSMGVVVAFFYIAFVFALVYWYQEPDLVAYLGDGVDDYYPHATHCSKLIDCWITMIRLSFYDGVGFDYMQTVILSGIGGGFYGGLLIIYMLVTGVIIIKGLKGIFCATFDISEKMKEMVSASELNETDNDASKEAPLRSVKDIPPEDRDDLTDGETDDEASKKKKKKKKRRKNKRSKEDEKRFPKTDNPTKLLTLQILSGIQREMKDLQLTLIENEAKLHSLKEHTLDAMVLQDSLDEAAELAEEEEAARKAEESKKWWNVLG